MTGNQTMDYYVQPPHIYLHSRTCTHSGLRRIPSILVAFHVCYHLDCATVHDISALMIWFQCISDIFIHYGDLDPLYIFSHYGDLDPLYIFIHYGDLDLLYIFIHYGDSNLLYIVHGDEHTCHILYIMYIHSHCTLMYTRLLFVFAVICRYLSLYCTDEWLVLPPWYSLLHFWDWFYNVFSPSCYPFYLTH